MLESIEISIFYVKKILDRKSWTRNEDGFLLLVNPYNTRQTATRNIMFGAEIPLLINLNK